MRYLFIAAAVLAGTGCVSVRQWQDSLHQGEQWRRAYEEERARREALETQLAELESALEAQGHARMEAEQAVVAFEAEQARTEAELRALEEQHEQLEERHAQLQAQQRRMAELQEQQADVWYQVALSRARRRSLPPLPRPPAPRPVVR